MHHDYIKPVTDTVTYVHPVDPYDVDPVFSGNERCNGGRSYTQETDRDYEYPDFKQYVFSTVKHPLWVMYPNNLVSEIRSKHTIAYSTKYLDRMCGSGSDGIGVFIVNCYYFAYSHHSSSEYKEHLAKRLKGLSIFKNNNAGYQDVINKINSLHTRKYYSSEQIEIRTITFVPYHVIARYYKVFIPSTGLVIGGGFVSDATVHPLSDMYFDSDKYKSDIKNTIEINVVDNTTTNDYYIRVGKKILKLHKMQDPTKPEGCYINLYSNELLIDTAATQLETSSKLGIYNNIEDAEYEGNVEHKLEEMKFQNELSKLQFEKEKLSIEIEKLTYEKERLTLERDKLGIVLQKNELERERIRFDTKKLSQDKILSEATFDYEIMKMKYELYILQEKRLTNMMNNYIDVQIKYFGFLQEIKIQNNRFKFETEKRLQSTSIDPIDAISKVTRLVSLFV